MSRVHFLPPSDLCITGSTITLQSPFLPAVQYALIHLHPSPHRAFSHNYVLDSASATVYCLARGLKGGGCFGSKIANEKQGLFYDVEAQRKASEGMQRAMASQDASEAGKLCEVLFDCETISLMLTAVESVSSCLRSSLSPWSWPGSSGQDSLILCGRLLRVFAVRSKLCELSNTGVLNGAEKQDGTSLLLLGKRLIHQAKSRPQGNAVLWAELRASWAVASGAVPRLSSEFDTKMSEIQALFESEKVVEMSQKEVVDTAVRFHEWTLSSKQKSFLLDMVLLTAIDFAVKSVPQEAVALLKSIIQTSMRWVTALISASILRKWLSTKDSLSPESQKESIALLKYLCSFQPFVRRNNWKLRSGALWIVLVMHENSQLRDLEPALKTIIETKKTMEKDGDVLAQVSHMSSYRTSQVFAETHPAFNEALTQEITDLSVFINESQNRVHSEQSSEAELEKYQKGIRKQLEKAYEAYEEMSTKSGQLKSQLKLIRQLTTTLDSILSTQTKLRVELGPGPTATTDKVDTLPRMRLVEECFYGREVAISTLKDLLGSCSASSSVAIIGEEGVGKSWLAIKYAQLYENEYESVCYLQADSASSIAIGLLELAKLFRCTKTINKDTMEEIREVLTTRNRVLLIYDNADFYVGGQGEEAVEEYMRLVFRTNGHVIITSRTGEWGERRNVLHLTPFSEEEAVGLIEEVAGVAGQLGIRELVRDLGCTPLCIKQAASLLKRTHRSIPDFRLQLSSKLPLPPIPSVLELCLDSLTPEAKELMELMALLNGSCIPLSMINGLMKGMTEAGVRSVLSDLRSVEFIDIDTQGVVVHKAFQLLSQRLCTQKHTREAVVSDTLNAMLQESGGNNSGFVSQARPYLNGKKGVQLSDVGIAKVAADRCEELELIFEEHLMREKQVQSAEAAHVSPDLLVTSYVDAACQCFRSNRSDEGLKEFTEALMAAGDDRTLKVRVKTALGKMMVRYQMAEQGYKELREADELSHGLEAVIPTVIADLSMHFALALMAQHRDQEALLSFQKAFAIRQNDPQNIKELVQVLLNLAYFYQTSSVNNLDEAERLNLEAARLISDEGNSQNGVIFRNLAILYGEKAKKNSQFLDKKHEFLMLNLRFRQKFHSQPTIDPEIAEIYHGIADVFIHKRDWQQAVNNLALSMKKLDSGSVLFNTVSKKYEAAMFYLNNPEVGRIIDR